MLVKDVLKKVRGSVRINDGGGDTVTYCDNIGDDEGHPELFLSDNILNLEVEYIDAGYSGACCCVCIKVKGYFIPEDFSYGRDA